MEKMRINNYIEHSAVAETNEVVQYLLENWPQILHAIIHPHLGLPAA